jgi:hypothetical protein
VGSKSKHGFAKLTKKERAELGARGGRAAAKGGKVHRWTPNEAKRAGKKGMQSRWRKRKRRGKS